MTINNGVGGADGDKILMLRCSGLREKKERMRDMKCSIGTTLHLHFLEKKLCMFMDEF